MSTFCSDFVCAQINLTGQQRFILLTRHMPGITLRFTQSGGEESSHHNIECFVNTKQQHVRLMYSDEVLRNLTAEVLKKQLESISTSDDYQYCTDINVKHFLQRSGKKVVVSVASHFDLDSILQLEFVVVCLAMVMEFEGMQLILGNETKYVDGVLCLDFHQWSRIRDLPEMIYKFKSLIQTTPIIRAEVLDCNEIMTLRKDSIFNLTYVA